MLGLEPTSRVVPSSAKSVPVYAVSPFASVTNSHVKLVESTSVADSVPISVPAAAVSATVEADRAMSVGASSSALTVIVTVFAATATELAVQVSASTVVYCAVAWTASKVGDSAVESLNVCEVPDEIDHT